MRNYAVSFLFLFTSYAWGIVDMKNANYSNTWVDIIVPGTGYDLRVSRTYNSRSLFSGMFGFGWCSDFETNVKITPEGNLKLTECGGGLEIVYTPRNFGKKDVEKTVATIINKMKADKKNVQGDKYFKTLTDQMYEDINIRSKYAQEYGITVPVKEGTTFLADGREVENFVLQKGFYVRTLQDGSSMRFNLQGKLTAMYDKNGNFLKIEYDKSSIREVVDNGGRKLTFKYFPNGKVKTISGPGGTSAEYKFKNLDDLSFARNAWNNTYTFEYDDLHNLTKASYPDNTFIALTYDTKKDWVMTFTDRAKCNEKYGYESDPKDPINHYWSTVAKTCGKEVVSNHRYEFWYTKRPDGRVFLQRVLTKINNNETDIAYHETFGRPISIRRNNEKLTFSYYDNGLVKTKTTPAFHMVFQYDNKISKVSQVTTDYMNDKGKKVSTKNTQFKYDGKGNLNFAQNSDGQKVQLTYDERGRIATIVDQAKRLVKIGYEDRFGKPATVTRPGVGSIRVSYKPSGEISKVDSKEGPSVAVQVASTFNNLLDIISPATNEVYL